MVMNWIVFVCSVYIGVCFESVKMVQMEGGDRLRETLLDRMSTVENSRSSLTGLTLEAVLMADKNVTSPQSQNQSNPTLLDVLQREHIQNHGGDNGTVWISSNSIPTSDTHIPIRDNEHHQLGYLLSDSGNVREEASSAEGRLRLGAILEEERAREEETSTRMSLMELLEDNEGKKMSLVGVDGEMAAEKSCCVCMVRRKGAAFIPCGHTFCRLCSRELWVQRGNCPLCNTSILEILHLF